MKYRHTDESFSPSLKLDGDSELKYDVQSKKAVEGFEMMQESEARCRRIFRGEILDKHNLESE